MSNERAIRSIAVAGGGIVGLSAALGFARALPNAAITVVETTPDPAALAETLPLSQASGARFHALIGLDEGELIRDGVASHFLGTLFEDWSASGEPWWHVLSPYGKPVGPITFDQIWLAARAAGRGFAYDRYAVGAALARSGKYVLPAADPDFIGSRFGYGLRLHPQRYRDLLRDRAKAARITFKSGDIARVDRLEDGGVAAMQLGEGARLEADLFIDCTGPSAVLAREVDDIFEEWSEWLPFAAMSLSQGEGGDVPAVSDQVRADERGWTAHMPLPGGTLTARLERSGGSDDSVTLTRGRRLRPWTGNLLALGDSAAALDPLHRLNLDMAHNAILLALELLPGRDFTPVETAEYNRRSEQVTRRVRDFLALHYLRSGRSDGLWHGFAAVQPPDSLARTLDQYEHRGRLPFHEEETVTRDSWSAALIGLGVLPHNRDPQVRNLALDEATAAMDRLVHQIDQAVAGVPDYADFLGRIRL